MNINISNYIVSSVIFKVNEKVFKNGVGGMSREAEQHRVNEIINEINNKEETIYKKSAGLKDTIINLRENFWDDVTVNLDEPDDVIETQASVKQQAELLIEREQLHGNMDKELKKLKKLKDSPYFGRIDFIENENENEKIYIGTSSLMDLEEENFLIYDWRAPISSLYYDYAPGKAQYETMDETITGEISLKRQFIIRQSNIISMFDTGLTIGDQLLQQALGDNASTTMKSIVATIQKEQNKIIRNERSDLLIVQGVAGSGKTSAVLQRIAYLMYRFRKELNANNLLLFSPNPLFSSYVANVLPELGEENIQQSTFYDFLEKRIEKGITIESPFSQMEYTLTEMDEKDYDSRLTNMTYKSSLDFKSLLDEYIFQLNYHGIRFRNITLHHEVLISKEQISDYFYSLEEISLPNRMEAVATWLLHELRKSQKQEKDKDWVMEKVELLDKDEYLEAYHSSQQEDEENSSLEEEFLRKEVVKRHFAQIKKRVKRFDFVHVLATYQEMFLNWETDQTPADWGKIRAHTAANLSQKFLTWEDATPYLYFKGRLLGDDSERSVRHLFIDEAQDYSAFQFAYIRHIFPYTRMTLLGDINQAIYAYATEDNPLIPAKLEQNHEQITLTKSYRSTKQIVEFTKDFAPGEAVIESFDRSGNKPKLIKLENKANRTDKVIAEIEELRSDGNETIAIICKTLKECDELYQKLQDKIVIRQITEQTYSFEKGLLILPIYLAKGIEFDAVIIPEVSAGHYAKESDRALFYTACTRAMHGLHMITSEEPCKFIKEAEPETFEVFHI
ncbi:DNA helicase-2 / ATP-dependent DNA helicase PcrA [Virgibacillus subterraneus]|uniref:DNA helicase-2 / ATP-dependent DNA helicase PcrA n=2 Tax=Virgibacillus subterraneus TaxID=621109 RepID=A0A1H9K8G4_9BACI|nr:DNA helicase-2 / ATP-dependent DNA helicase PcrA [Virgibacillus subterraneus]